MSLRWKLQLLVGALSLLFVLVVLGLQVKAMRESVTEEVAAAHRVAAQLLRRTTMFHQTQGTPGMLAFLRGLGRVRSTDITLVDGNLNELYRSPPSPYKAGRDAPAWFAALVTPPPQRQAIEFADGMLEMRANASRAALDAWDSFVVLLSGALLMLLALNLLVAWVLDHTTRPFGRIVEAIGAVEGGRFDTALPPLPGREAGSIAAAFNRMVARLREQRETEQRAMRAEAQLSDSRELAAWVDHHVEQERRTIARELHDELGQSVTAMRSLALSIAQRSEGRDADAAQAARLIADEASRLYDAMHGLIPRLTPLVLDRFGLPDALADLVERTRRSHPQVTVALQRDGAEAPLAPDAALALYRAAQEGITNALRHGGAQTITLALRREGGELALDVTDDGSGLAPDWQQRPGHHGLRWMAERLATLRGRFALAAAEPRGVRLTVAVPLETSA
jgi:two-component system sensor histidine kinase UhpB